MEQHVQVWIRDHYGGLDKLGCLCVYAGKSVSQPWKLSGILFTVYVGVGLL